MHIIIYFYTFISVLQTIICEKSIDKDIEIPLTGGSKDSRDVKEPLNQNGFSWKGKAKLLQGKIPSLFHWNRTSSKVDDKKEVFVSSDKSEKVEVKHKAEEEKEQIETNEINEEKDSQRDKKEIVKEAQEEEISPEDVLKTTHESIKTKDSHLSEFHRYLKGYFDKSHQRGYSSYLDDEDMVHLKQTLLEIVSHTQDTNPDLYQKLQYHLSNVSKKTKYTRVLKIWKAIGDPKVPSPFPRLNVSIFFHGWLTLFLPLFVAVAAMVILKTFCSLVFNR